MNKTTTLLQGAGWISIRVSIEPYFLDVSERSTEVKKQIFAPKENHCDDSGAVTDLSTPTLSRATLGNVWFFEVTSCSYSVTAKSICRH